MVSVPDTYTNLLMDIRKTPVYARPSSCLSTRWSPKLSLPQNFEGHVTRFAPHQALKLIA